MKNNHMKRSLLLVAVVGAMAGSLMIPTATAAASTGTTAAADAVPSSDNVYRTELPQNGNVVNTARYTLNMKRFGTNLIPTGIAAAPEDTLIVTVSGDNLKQLPSIVFTQSKADGDNWRRSQQLTKGINVITVPTIYRQSEIVQGHAVIPGGAIYLENPYTAATQGDAPTVEIKGGIDFPLYIQDETDEATFKEELATYAAKVSEDPDTYPDIFEYDSDRILYAGLASGANKVFNTEGVDISNSVDYWDARVDDMFTFAGMSDNATEAVHNSAGMKTTIRVMQPYGGAYADDDHIGVRQGYNDGFLRTNTDWGIIHELGHQMDQDKLTFSEITNNMWSVNFYYKAGKYDWGVGNAKDVNGTMDWTDGASYSNRLELFWNLEEAHPGFWAEIQSIYREESDSMRFEDAYFSMVKYFAQKASDVLQRDLTEYFNHFNFLAGNQHEEEILAHMQQYPPLEKKYQYYNNSVRKNPGDAFTDELSVEVTAATDAENNSATLTFAVNEADANNILGYEVSYGDTVLGFSRDNVFKHTSSAIDFTKNVTYTVVPYDKQLNAGAAIEFSTLPNQSDQDTSDNATDSTEEPVISEQAEAMYRVTSTKVQEILTQHEADLSQSEEIYMFYPTPAEFEGTAVDEEIVSDLRDAFTDRITGRLTITISDTANFTTVDEFMAALCVTYQAGDGQPIYYFTPDGEVTVY